MLLSALLRDLEYTGSCPDREITDLIIDSRRVGPGCAFICLRGASVDSHRFAAQAAQAGAAVIFAEYPVEADAPVLLVPDTRRALALLSAAFFGCPAKRLTTIGITGTKGKTTTTSMLRAILEAAGHKVGTIGTIGVVIGDTVTPLNNTTPESYDVHRYLKEMADAGCDFCVMEVSSIGLKAHRVEGITFDVGLFTNFSPDHIGGNEHKDMEEYLFCKSLLFRKCRIGVINADDAAAQGILQGHTCQVETYGFSEQAGLRASDDHLISRPDYLGAGFTLSGQLTGDVRVRIPGTFSVYNALSAIAVCRLFDIPMDVIQQGLDTVTVKGRVEPVPVPGSYTLLIDYAHNAVSMENILTTLRAYQPNRLICLFGAGGNRPKIRRYEMGEVCGNLADLSVITADNSRFEDVMDIIADIKTGMAKTNGHYVVIPDRRDAIRYCIEQAQERDIIVLAGKGHEDYQEICGVKHHFDEREVVAEILQTPNQTKVQPEEESL